MVKNITWFQVWENQIKSTTTNCKDLRWDLSQFLSFDPTSTCCWEPCQTCSVKLQRQAITYLEAFHDRERQRISPEGSCSSSALWSFCDFLWACWSLRLGPAPPRRCLLISSWSTQPAGTPWTPYVLPSPAGCRCLQGEPGPDQTYQ